jgi:ABC-type glycerol-3-phosphate transport system substrate-binding protein
LICPNVLSFLNIAALVHWDLMSLTIIRRDLERHTTLTAPTRSVRSRFAPDLAAWNNIRGDVSEAVEKVFLGKATPKEALDAAAVKANARLR